MKRRFSASSRLINELFTQYQSTFLAFCELINNSIQADAKKIDIQIDYAKDSEMSPTMIKKIVIKDYGFGVHQKEIDKKLWIFGEQYNKNTRLLSDTNLENNLTELRNKYLPYRASKQDDNINEKVENKLKSITDLFIYSERIIDEKKREVLVVELKAPRVKISPKELEQVMGYANEIATKDFFSDNIQFHIILISSSINEKARFRIKGQQKGKEDPYFYFENESGNIKVLVVKWSDLIETNKRKLKYMSNVLKTKDISIQQKIESDFKEIEFKKVRSFLRKVNIQD